MGRVVAVTREAGRNGELRALLQAGGAEVVEVPLIRFAPALSAEQLRAELTALQGWLLLTSPQAARALTQLARPSDLPQTARVAVVGEGSAQPLRAMGWRVDFLPSRAEAQALGTELPMVAGETALHPTSQLSRDTLGRVLGGRGVHYRALELYRTAATSLSGLQRADLRRADVVTLASGSAAQALVAAAGTDFTVAVMGQQTFQAARQAGLARVVQAREPSLVALAQAACESGSDCLQGETQQMPR